jgi:O-succinylbenzoic acid--CoA ligase
MMYPYPTCWIDGRSVSIKDIRQDTVPGTNDFERHTFGFIRAWLNGQQHFELRTSGSTGVPKTIVLTRDQMTASAQLTAAALKLQPGLSALVCLDTQYIAGQMMIVRCLVTGMQLFATTPAVNPFQALPAEVRIDFAALVPYQVYGILASPARERFNTLKTVIIGGAPLQAGTRDVLESFSCRFYATYGMTETISHIALQALNGKNASVYFDVLPGVQIGQDERQCLTIEAPHLPQKVITNDIVAVDGQRFQWLGRWDNVINSGGVKIIPEKVEAEIVEVFQRLAIEYDFFIAGLPDERLGEKVFLIIQGAAFDDALRERLSRALREYLPRYEIPREVVVLKSFVFTENGKLNRYHTVQNIDKSLQNFTLKS